MLTFRQFLYIFFAETYTTQSLISENIAHFLKGVRLYHSKCQYSNLAHQILENRCDENFFLVFSGIQSTIKSMLKRYLSKKHPKNFSELLQSKIKGDKALNENETDYLVRNMIDSNSKGVKKALEVKSSVLFVEVEKVILNHFICK
jgi:hypothetical protein